MTRSTLVAAALIATAILQAEAAAARNVTARHAATHVTTDCVRAPAEGAFVSDPYKQPPCLPNTAYASPN
ncbi:MULTISPECIES: hypothetical protein [Bradyrhizobium]|uniref:Uncharacterized protein n=1 Tax=Bradyrhizobium vignae TaxID=1549949 RepID=A0ABS3ZVQ4_9BRAD|nr:hypothetical protein [Bradyrhizobium vignae]MBP0112234.1 hypothetical protein [Bradyrhizobium vignae]